MINNGFDVDKVGFTLILLFIINGALYYFFGNPFVSGFAFMVSIIIFECATFDFI